MHKNKYNFVFFLFTITNNRFRMEITHISCFSVSSRQYVSATHAVLSVLPSISL
jgi:hypothetical protein